MEDLLAIIETLEQNALGGLDSTLGADRAAATNLYLGGALGNEVEGRSQVVSRDVMDTVEWIKPSLLKTFLSGDEVCRFEPTSAEDEPLAEQETFYCNDIILNRNHSFPVVSTWIHDGLVTKNGYVKAYWEESTEVIENEYRGVSDEELMLLVQDGVEVIQHESYFDQTGIQLHNIRTKENKNTGNVKLVNIPPEEILVDDNHRDVSLLNAGFVQHRRIVTISELREMGYDVDDDIASYDEWEDEEHDVRNLYGEENNYEAEPAMRRVMYRETYIKHDQDGDGIAELRKVCVVGKEILHNDTVEIIPIAAWTPTILPHRHVGMSVADAIGDLQVIKTTLLRNALDSQYLAIHGRWGVDATKTNIQDLLTSRPGGIVRFDGPPQNAIMPLANPIDGTKNIAVLEYFDKIRTQRTGVSEATQGLDPNALNKTATGTQQLISAAQQRVELIARSLAETGFKDLMLIVHKTTLENARKPQIIRMRNEWVPVDPRSWKTRYDMRVSVGLGTGNKMEQLGHLMTILQAQREALQIGIATPKNIYNALAELTKNAGFKSVEQFWTDPDTVEPPPPQPNPEEMKVQAQMQLEQMKQQADVQKFQAQVEMEREKAKLEIQTKVAEQQAQSDERRIELEMEAERNRQKMEYEAQLALQKAQYESEMEVARLEFDRWKAQLESETRILVAQIQAHQQEQKMMLDAEREQARMEVANRPKKVIRDENGNISGVE